MYLIRKLAIEKTNKEHVVYPIALILAVYCEAIQYCLKNDIKIIACGYSAYQAKEDRYIEQSNHFVSLTKDFLKDYGIILETPVIKNKQEEIMDILEKYDISSNSLENKSVFGGIWFNTKHADEYWKSSILICKKYLEDKKK
jgi:hypothetical protein